MTAKEFKAALARLKVNHTHAARLLGIGRASVVRYATGQYEVPEIVSRLLTMLESRGIPKEWRT